MTVRMHLSGLSSILLVVAALVVVTAAVYAPGLSGGFVFDDYPNIVDNTLIHPNSASLADLVGAALSSPSSELKRPLASLSFAANFLVSGLDPVAMKVTNLAIHLLNGVLLFFLVRRLLALTWGSKLRQRSMELTAGGIALGWLLLPINLTAVLYIVQRMESLANLFVLLGLLAYIKGRESMLRGRGGILRSALPLMLGTLIGIAAKETAILLPLYAFLLEITVFNAMGPAGRLDRRLTAFYALFLLLPLLAGLAWLLPIIFSTSTWATRDFTLSTRLLSEGRVLLDYIEWTLLPTRSGLSFYHDDFIISSNLFHPWTTLPSIVLVLGLAVTALAQRRRFPLAALGILWFLACHSLTGTILPLELIYEHRNYFASIGLLLALADLSRATLARLQNQGRRRWLALAPAVVLLGWWGALTTTTAVAWGEPLALARELAERGPDSPRAQYELGRAYIIYSHYAASSPYAELAYAPLEHAAQLPGSSILPLQALIFMNSRMDRPMKDGWWSGMIAKLASRPATVQDESSLDALARCLAEGSCRFDAKRLDEAFQAALSHPSPSARLLAMYATFALRTLNQTDVAYARQREAVAADPGEAAYRITLARMARQRGDRNELEAQIEALSAMNTAGRLDRDLSTLRDPSTSSPR